MARPGCPDKCGNISIPYPFGTGKGCFQEPFNVTCNGTGVYLGSNGLRVLDISLTLGEVRVQNPHIASRCNFSNGSNSTSGLDVLTLDPFHTVSNTKNKLTSIGCGGLAMVVGQAKGKNQLEYLTADSCISSCMDVSSIGNGTECSGMGCCQAPVSGNINAFLAQSIPVSAIYNSTIQSFSPCTYSFVAEDDWFKFDRSYINSTNFGRKYTDGVPLVLDWVVGNGSCSETSKMGSQYACQAMNSECIDVSNGPGYRCNCSQGYEGNPYLQGGCKGTYMHLTELTYA
uniref:Wall-associated receptor kinase galacturonan-binding domain-containing protein n=1 Tax=Aegilops tauschii subsp. strangulata TaxID=200361 RepID=A0A453QMH6_AEGTS